MGQVEAKLVQKVDKATTSGAGGPSAAEDGLGHVEGDAEQSTLQETCAFTIEELQEWAQAEKLGPRFYDKVPEIVQRGGLQTVTDDFLKDIGIALPAKRGQILARCEVKLSRAKRTRFGKTQTFPPVLKKRPTGHCPWLELERIETQIAGRRAWAAIKTWRFCTTGVDGLEDQHLVQDAFDIWHPDKGTFDTCRPNRPKGALTICRPDPPQEDWEDFVFVGQGEIKICPLDPPQDWYMVCQDFFAAMLSSCCSFLVGEDVQQEVTVVGGASGRAEAVAAEQSKRTVPFAFCPSVGTWFSPSPYKMGQSQGVTAAPKLPEKAAEEQLVAAKQSKQTAPFAPHASLGTLLPLSPYQMGQSQGAAAASKLPEKAAEVAASVQVYPFRDYYLAHVHSVPSMEKLYAKFPAQPKPAPKPAVAACVSPLLT